MSIHVFLGPSLPLDQARSLLAAEYHPPVRVGDVCDLVVGRQPPAAVAVIDGLFEQTPTVWHKEILYALSRGVRVFGASSMGAIRAAELHQFGMEGVGEVFERFRSGQYEDDDEVAVAHASAEDGHRPLSDAMVNIRDGLQAAQRHGVIGPDTAAVLVAGAKALFYPERSWAAVYQIGRQRGVPAGEISGLGDFVRATAPDVKRRDAATLLSHLAALAGDGISPATVEFDFEPTYNWEKLVRIVLNRRHAAELGRRLGSEGEPALDRVDPGLVNAALLDFLADRESDRLGLVGEDGGELTGPSASAALINRYRDELNEYLLARMTGGGAADSARGKG